MTDNEFKERESFLAKAESFLTQGLYQMAQELALNRLTKFPADADARIIVCHAWTRMGKLDKVKQMLREVDEAIFNMSRIYARMGDICRQSGLSSEAVSFYRKFITLNPGSSLAESVSEKLDLLLSSQEQTDISEEETDMEERRPVSGLKTVTMAELYLKQGHSDLAQEVLKECLKKDPANQRAAAVLRSLQAGAAVKTTKANCRAPGEVVYELSRWLNNMHRLRSHAA